IKEYAKDNKTVSTLVDQVKGFSLDTKSDVKAGAEEIQSNVKEGVDNAKDKAEDAAKKAEDAAKKTEESVQNAAKKLGI
ncbi:MAG: YtxH domain-containing protein, partial [Prevotella nanceiensis]|nr:YtxH domain-containing protein [Hoylesella nanceiensis]